MAKQAKPKQYESIQFGRHPMHNRKIQSLFEDLMNLAPMDKYGPMSGKCAAQTDQMEDFLQRTFGFKNIPGEYIVQGVKAFKLHVDLRHLHPNQIIYFPSPTDKQRFAMSVGEIREWQHTYKVYADRDVEGIDTEFLQRALQGKSADGEEAFRMKFVVRISTCPILMEFDAKVIPRQLHEDWPHRIKLVSVTGIDFAGRKHDVGDILYYLSNWRDVFQVDPESDQPLVYNRRDFSPRANRSRTKLHLSRVERSLMRMARLRLRSCDAEGVQIVVETGIGLGVFAGTHIGIDAKIRALSANAIRKVLQEDGRSYKNIQAVVFALPIFNSRKSGKRTANVFDDFTNEFRHAQYNGPIPVLIADQDMHRLTVAIARQGFVVSELNPADSHGVFGEYWQNRGPAVEEKLALTTIGLLVQHHLINNEVLNENNYHLITVGDGQILNWKASVYKTRRMRSITTCFRKQ